MYDVAYSILAHESPKFLDFQLSNIFHFNKDKNIFVIVHFNKYFWDQHSAELKNICQKYNVYINENKFQTQWRSSSIFDAIVSNLDYIVKNIHFKYYTMLSSNELFIKNGLADYINNLDFDIIHYDHKACFGSRDLSAMLNDIGLQKFIKEYNTAPKIGFDFGRILNFNTSRWLLEKLYQYWSFPITPTVFDYSMSESIITTVLNTGNFKLIENVMITKWYNGESYEDIIHKSDLEKYFIAKHLPKDFNNTLVSSIAKSMD